MLLNHAALPGGVWVDRQFGIQQPVRSINGRLSRLLRDEEEMTRVFPAVIGISVLVGMVRGGRLSGLGSVSFRGWWAVIMAFGLQAVLLWFGGRGWPWPVPVASLLHVLSYILLLYALALNRGLYGVSFLLAGAGLNGLVILLNGRMPVSAAGLVRSGQEELLRLMQVKEFTTHVLTGPGTRLAFLGDVLSVAGFPKVFSIGDVLMAAGIFLLVQGVMLRAAPAKGSKNG